MLPVQRSACLHRKYKIKQNTMKVPSFPRLKTLNGYESMLSSSGNLEKGRFRVPDVQCINFMVPSHSSRWSQLYFVTQRSHGSKSNWKTARKWCNCKSQSTPWKQIPEFSESPCMSSKAWENYRFLHTWSTFVIAHLVLHTHLDKTTQFALRGETGICKRLDFYSPTAELKGTASKRDCAWYPRSVARTSPHFTFPHQEECDPEAYETSYYFWVHSHQF